MADIYTIEITNGGAGYTSAPAATSAVYGWVRGAGVIGNPTKAFLSWVDAGDADIARIDIYRGPDSDNANATKIGEAAPGDQSAAPDLSVDVGVSEWFFLKSVDEAGNESAFTVGVEVTRT